MARSTGGNELTLDEIGDAIKNGEKVALVVCPSSESAIGIAAARRFAYALKTATSGCETVVHTSDDKIVKRTAVSISKVFHGKDEWGALRDKILGRDMSEADGIRDFEKYLWSDDEYYGRRSVPLRIFVTSAGNVREIMAYYEMAAAAQNAREVMAAIKGRDGKRRYGRLTWREDSTSDLARLRKLVYAGAKSRWGELKDCVVDRLEFELESIEGFGRTAYMLMTAEVVEAIRNAGGLISPGRGANVGSAVCYALGISGIDPLEHDLLFERFMNPRQKADATLVLVDTDAAGEKAALSVLSKYGEVKPEPRRKYYAPQYYEVNGWSIGVTRFAPVEVVSSVLALLKENGKAQPDVDHLPYDDAETLELFRRGDLDGLFFYDTPLIRQAFRALDKQIVFDDIVNIGVFSYPGRFMMRTEFIARQHRLSVLPYCRHPLVERHLRNTFGLLAYQEQLLILLRVLGGFSWDDAEKSRKAFAKMLLDVQAEMRPRFIEGCIANGRFREGEFADEALARKAATEIWNEWERTARHCFMKAHQVAFARLAYQLAYFKVHYPAEWLYAIGKVNQPVREVVRKSVGEMTLNHIRSALEMGSRVVLLIRHAERPPLDPSDTSFGATLPLTDGGREDAQRLGVQLADMISPSCVRLCASRTFRTIETACEIARGMTEAIDLAKHPVTLSDELGSTSPFFGSLEERLQLIAEGNYRERLNDYYRGGEQRGYRSLGAATDEMENSLDRLSSEGGGLTVAVTHDINVASFLAGRGVVTEFTEASWPYYLDAAVVIADASGEREYGVLRASHAPRGIDL